MRLNEQVQELYGRLEWLKEKLEEEINDRENLEIRFDELKEKCDTTIKGRTSQLFDQKSQTINLRHRIESLEELPAKQNKHINKLAEQITELDHAYSSDIEAVIEYIHALQDKVKELEKR